ncbi:acyltransferase domain-containing protein [Mariniluteicoccus flavus]
MDPRPRLLAALDDDRLDLLGFRPDDAADLRGIVTDLVDDEAAMARVATLAERLIGQVGRIAPLPGEQPAVFDESDRVHPRGRGILPLLALLATVDDVRAHHRDRGIDDAASWRALSDLGQQVWVNRLTYAAFGLHTHRWLLVAWSGALAWLGRLQFNLARPEVDPHRGELVLSTHIPQSGPLDPDEVDRAFAEAEDFFAAHFPDLRPAWFHCESWLLDPRLAAALPGSNIAAFQQRWELFGDPQPGTADAVFFTFRRRGDVTADDLTANSRLEALVTDHVRSDEPLHVRHGRIPFTGSLLAE